MRRLYLGRILAEDQVQKMNKPSVVIADAQYLIRFALRQLLENRSQCVVVDEVADEEELLQAVVHHQPDLVVLDYDQQDSFQLETIQRVQQAMPGIRFLIISADENKSSIYQALERGVHSFLTKNCDETEIIDAVGATLKGEKFYCSQIIDYLLEKSFARQQPSLSSSPLTPREIQIVQLIAKGFVAKEISKHLNLSTHTVYTHRKNIMRKLDLNSSSELVLYAVQKGLVKGE